jgi:hypothetical protein
MLQDLGRAPQPGWDGIRLALNGGSSAGTIDATLTDSVAAKNGGSGLIASSTARRSGELLAAPQFCRISDYLMDVTSS